MSGRDVTQPVFSALGVPIDVEVWEEQSVYSEATASSRAGVPVPDSGEGSSKLGLVARGNQAAAGGIQVRSAKGGFASRQAAIESGFFILDNGATFIWRPATLSLGVTTYGSWRGWDPPRSVARWQNVIRAPRVSFNQTTEDPCVITLASGALLLAVEVEDQSQPLNFQIAIYQRSGVTDAWSRVTGINSLAAAPSTPFRPCLLQLPSGRILLYYVSFQTGPVYRLTGWFSDDDGQTWSFLGDGLCNDDFAAAPLQLKMAYKDTQIVLFANLTGGDIAQFASSDSGNSFQFIRTATTLDSAMIDVTATTAGFILALSRTTSLIQVIPFGDAYTAIRSADIVEINPSAGNSDVALCTDETGVVYLFYNDSNVIDSVISFDSGLTWTTYADTATAESIRFGAGTAPRDFTVTACRGQIIMVACRTVPTDTTADDSLDAYTLGGFTTLCMPRYARTFGQAAVQGWDRNYNPVELPGATGAWTATSTGGSTEAIATGALVLTSTGGTQWYRASPTTTIALGLMVSITLSVQVGAAFGQELSAQIVLDDGGNDTGVRIEWTTSQWRLVDVNGGGVIGVAQTYTSGIVEVLVAIQNQTARSWWRSDTQTESGVREWTTGPAAVGSLNLGAIDTADRVDWGLRAAGTRTATIYDVKYSVPSSVNLAQDQDSPDDLFGRPYATASSGVYAGKNVTIQARGGPTWLGETWTIQARNDRGLERALDLPSPRMGWVSAGTSQILALLWDDGVALGTEAVASPNLIAIYIGNSNAESVTVKYRNTGGSSWTSLGAATRSIATGLAFDCFNNTIRPTSTDAGLYFRRGELIGGHFVDTALGQTYEITGNSEGRWGTGNKLCTTLTLASTTGTATGNSAGRIVPKDSVILVDLSGINTPGLQLTLTTSNAAVKAGVIKLYKIVGLGRRYDHGRTIDLDMQGIELAEARDRTIRARNAAPPRRVVSFAWMEAPIDQRDADHFGDPNYIYGSTDATGALAGVGSTPYTVESVGREVEGATDPLLYIPAVPVASGLRVLNRRHQMLYGRLVSDISIENVLGEEGDSELSRVASLEIQEEV